MTPEEAINAATINGAYAMGLSASHGSITIGKGKSYFDYSNSFLLPTSLRLWQ
jgi:cytosine/adenosine deaminase-related metal-dependent hydrolase